MNEVIQMSEKSVNEYRTWKTRLEQIKAFEDRDFYTRRHLRNEISGKEPTTIEGVVGVFRKHTDCGSYEPGFLINEFFGGDENLLKFYLEDTLEEVQTLRTKKTVSVYNNDEEVILTTKQVEGINEEDREGGHYSCDWPESLNEFVDMGEGEDVSPDEEEYEWSISKPYLNLPE